jgi:Domain of unknown function (DUF4148)
MNRKSAFALVFAAAITGSAFAEDYNQNNPVFEGSRSRADVQAELFSAKQSGVNPWSNQYNPLAQFRSTKTRDQVTAEYVAARERVAAFTGEDSGSGVLAGRGQAAGHAQVAQRAQ